MDDPISCPLPFKFNHSWFSNEDFVQMIRSEWPLISSGSPVDAMEDLSAKLHLLKGKVKDLTRTKSMEMKYKSILLEDEINCLLKSSTSGILGARDQSRLIALRLELKRWLNHELLSTRLQSKVTWALQGDSNTKFFHAVA